jgi:hypothetical protein
VSIYQKVCIVCGLLLILLSILFPNWSVRSVDFGGLEVMRTRGFIYSEGHQYYNEYLEDLIKKLHQKGTPLSISNIPKATATIDYGRMFVEVTLIILLTVGGVVLLHPRRPSNY